MENGLELNGLELIRKMQEEKEKHNTTYKEMRIIIDMIKEFIKDDPMAEMFKAKF